MLPDLDGARRFVQEHRPPPGRVLLCAVTGAHLYGFPSADSDVDLKGIHLAPTEQLLGLAAAKETHDVTLVVDSVEYDLTTHELGMALRAVLKGNGNVIERVVSPLQLFDTEEVEALRALLPDLLSQRVHAHYAGFFRQTCRFFDREARVKTLLYSVRVALTGIHLLRTGEVEAHLPTLAETHGFSEVMPLVDLKRERGEKAVIRPEVAAPIRRRWPELEERLREARDASCLPVEPPGREAAEAWLVQVRRDALRA
ncbi:MAG: nucleotidyltransferase domain-containing protein [Myxococcota bacterium]